MAKSRARKLYREWLVQPKCIVMDDERYIKEETMQTHGQEFFVGKTRLGVPKKFQKKKVDKFALRGRRSVGMVKSASRT